MRKFADLNLQLGLERVEETERTICKAAELGYRMLGISIPGRAKKETTDFLKKTCRKHGVDFAPRADLHPQSSRELLSELRLLRRRFAILAVNCATKAVARQAAKDRRVDLLVFSSNNPRKRFFDISEARLASQGLAALEIDCKHILWRSGFDRISVLSSLRREATIAEKLRIPVVVCSGASNWLELRGPHQMASLTTLFGLSEELALDAISEVPYEIVMRNRKKQDGNYVGPGISVRRRGEACDC
ncbi:MAG: hypothetical protein NWE81_02090 [Candidatus Bathyarchaeota archaeon]|nr:hypothetical protein [Candidatus Bathyarchaeota archaeon]